MISDGLRRTQFSLNLSSTLQLALFVAYAFCSTGAYSSNISPPVSITSKEGLSMLALAVAIVSIAVAAVWWITLHNDYSKLTDEEKNSTTKLSYFITHRWVTVAALVLLSLGHYLMGELFGDHSVPATFIIVAVIYFLERLFHRLTVLPEKIAKSAEVAAQTLNEAVMKAIPNSLVAKRFFVTGTSHRKNVDSMLQFIHAHDKLEASCDGISIFRFDSSADDYAKVCEHFLEKSEQIEGMTDLDFDKLLLLFKHEEGDVMSWVKKVNAKMMTSAKPEIRRVLVLTEERRRFLEALETLLDKSSDGKAKVDAKLTIESYSRLPVNGSENFRRKIDQFVEDAKTGLTNFKSTYCCPGHDATHTPPNNFKFLILAKESQEIGGGYKHVEGPFGSFHEQLRRGEFIMFDRKYLVRFNSDAKLLEISFGEILEEFAKAFAPTTNADERLLTLAGDCSFKGVTLPLESYSS